MEIFTTHNKWRWGHAIYGLDYKCSRSIGHNAIHLDIVQNLNLTNFITIEFEELKN